MTDAARPRSRGAARFTVASGFLVVLAACFAALAIWQVERRAGKLALIARIEARVGTEPSVPPGPAGWNGDVEYSRVRLEGRFADGLALTQALTERGGGYWVLQPFRTGQGFTVLVNRGFVPLGTAPGAIAPPPPNETGVTGLVRLTEPKGGFLRSNDPAAGRWYSRDVAAIAAAQGVSDVAPYFVDAEAGAEGTAGGGVVPVGGLTVLRFSNNHLVYALTWAGLALLSLFGLVQLLRHRQQGEARARRP